MAQDMDGRVAAYRGLVETLAQRVARSRRARRVNAEYDDLYQEGLLAIWQALQRNVTPKGSIIELRLLSYVRWLGYQTGQHLPGCELDPETGVPIGECPQHVPYDALLPLDDFRGTEA